jgi:hypothetical protein
LRVLVVAEPHAGRGQVRIWVEAGAVLPSDVNAYGLDQYRRLCIAAAQVLYILGL